jgi:hypothetical protein
VDQACYYAPAKRNHCRRIVIDPNQARKNLADLEVVESSWHALRLLPGQLNPSRSSVAWKVPFGLRCPSRDTRAQTIGDVKQALTRQRSRPSVVPSYGYGQPPEPRATGRTSAFLVYFRPCPCANAPRQESGSSQLVGALPAVNPRCYTSDACAKSERDS